jgi:SEC-C motif-containing protein
MKNVQKPQSCPCGGLNYATCCEPFHIGTSLPETPEQLMRSRYSAYVNRNEPYLLETWHARTKPSEPLFSDDLTKWLGLTIKKAPVAINDKGTVEFVAIYKIDGKAHRLSEISNFVKENGRWVYLDGIFPS